ncbi:MAG TPA: class I SAM-dependent methyltransferase, partial [Bacteroidia bacterium]|nr:class I SAM-dependent methyltransferase [Bacteroidia bacterium]
GKITPASHVLEIGCGTGIFTKLIYESTNASIVAIDISDDLLDQAVKKLPNVEFKIEDAMHTGFANESFDCVFGSSVLHHLDLNRASKEIFRVTKKGGSIVFAEPNMLNPQILIQKNIPFIKKWVGDSPDERAIVRWEFKSLLKKIGFRNVQIFPYDFLHPFTPSFMIPVVNGIGKMVEKIPLLKEIAGSVIIYAQK